MEKKTISVSSKRQITIPQKFFEMLGIKNEVDCYVEDGAIIIKPVSIETTGEFATAILKELVAQGLSGEELIRKFEEMNKIERPAIEEILLKVENAAYNHISMDDSDLNHIFGAEE